VVRPSSEPLHLHRRQWSGRNRGAVPSSRKRVRRHKLCWKRRADRHRHRNRR